RSGAVQRVFFGWLAVVLSFGLVLTISRGAWLAIAGALIAWPFFSLRSSLRRRMAVAAATLVLLLLAGGAVFAASATVQERFTALVRDAGERSRPVLWRAGWAIFRAHPIFGSGAGSYNVMFE